MKDIKVIFKLDDFRGVTKNILKLDRIVRAEKIKIIWGIWVHIQSYEMSSNTVFANRHRVFI